MLANPALYLTKSSLFYNFKMKRDQTGHHDPYFVSPEAKKQWEERVRQLREARDKRRGEERALRSHREEERRRCEQQPTPWRTVSPRRAAREAQLAAEQERRQFRQDTREQCFSDLLDKFLEWMGLGGHWVQVPRR